MWVCDHKIGSVYSGRASDNAGRMGLARLLCLPVMPSASISPLPISPVTPRPTHTHNTHHYHPTPTGCHQVQVPLESILSLASSLAAHLLDHPPVADPSSPPRKTRSRRGEAAAGGDGATAAATGGLVGGWGRGRGRGHGCVNVVPAGGRGCVRHAGIQVGGVGAEKAAVWWSPSINHHLLLAVCKMQRGLM